MFDTRLHVKYYCLVPVDDKVVEQGAYNAVCRAGAAGTHR